MTAEIDAAATGATMPPMPRRVLVVDDDPHIRQLLAFAFAKAGMEVSEAGDGEEALESAARAMPDLVVLDITMPKMDGLEVCRRLRATSEVPILFLSSRDEEIDRVLGIELGADDYVVKPFSPREVVARAKAIQPSVPRRQARHSWARGCSASTPKAGSPAGRARKWR
jgi:two-component system, OmpR family, response regulator